MTAFASTTIDSQTGETFQTISCMACGEKADLYDGTTDKGWAEVRRGALAAQHEDGELTASELAERENIKFSRYICPKCFMEDPDLCRFFNRCGCRIR